MDPCTFPVMHTLSIGLYPSAHFWTWKLYPLAHIPPGRGTRVFIHGSLHISRHGNSVHWPVSLQGGAPEFLSTDPCTFPDMETPSIGVTLPLNVSPDLGSKDGACEDLVISSIQGPLMVT